jgi:thiamine pyrophosphokinase
LTAVAAVNRLPRMEALLVAGGEAPPRSRFEARFGGFGLVCAADSGLDTLVSWGLTPDLVVGDMDSVSDPGLVERFPKAELLFSPRDKDETDTELGLRALAERGAERIILAGGGGGRLDHLLAIRSLFERRGGPRPAEWHTRGEAIYLVRESRKLELEVHTGATVSVFPLADGAEGMSSEGLKWPLSGLAWGPGDCGVSNVAMQGRISVSSGKGDLLVLLLLPAVAEGRL